MGDAEGPHGDLHVALNAAIAASLVARVRFAPIAARGGQTIAALAGALALTAPNITDQSMNTKTSEDVTCITPPATPPVTSSVPQALADRPMRCCTNRRTMVRQQKGTTMKTLITALTLAALIAATQSPALAQLMGW